MRTVRRRISVSTPPRLGQRGACVHFRAMSCRCQRSSVSGVTTVAISRSRLRPNRYARTGESAPIVVDQVQASVPQLAAKHAILFEQIANDISLLTIQPPGEEREQQLERGDVDHGGESISRAAKSWPLSNSTCCEGERHLSFLSDR